MYWQKLN